MKCLLYSDVHFSQYSSIVRSRGEKYSTRLHNLIDSISWAEKLAEEHNCDRVINLGDFFDRPEITAEEVTALQDVYFNKLPHTFLTGNHDANIANLEFSSVQIFKSINADIITEPIVEEVNDKVDLYFIPYLTEDRIKPIKAFLKNNDKKKVVISHNDLAGIQYGKFTSQSGFEVNDIADNCNLFLNGHLHNGCMIKNNIILVGNLTGQNFNENAMLYDHYVYIMEIKDNGEIVLESFINPYAFNFYKLSIYKEADIAQLDKLKNNAVVSVACIPSLLTKVNDLLAKNKKIIEYRITGLYVKADANEETVDFTVEDHLQQFIDYVQTKITPSVILTEELTRLSSM